MTQEPQEFDLRGIAHQLWIEDIPIVGLYLFVGVLTALGAWLGNQEIRNGLTSGVPLQWVALTAGCAFYLCAISIILPFRLLVYPRQLVVSGEGLVMFERGREANMRWADPKAKWSLLDTSDYPDPTARRYVLYGPGLVNAAITKEALDAVLRLAKEKGVLLEGERLPGPYVAIRYPIGGGHRRPRPS
jgi:hypothetical protein